METQGRNHRPVREENVVGLEETPRRKKALKALPELDGKTEKMYRGGKICLDSHFRPLWARNVPRFGIAHAMALGVRAAHSDSPPHPASSFSVRPCSHPLLRRWGRGWLSRSLPSWLLGGARARTRHESHSFNPARDACACPPQDHAQGRE